MTKKELYEIAVKYYKLKIEDIIRAYEFKEYNAERNFKIKLSEEKSRFDSLLRDKIKMSKELKRARKGIDYWKRKDDDADYWNYKYKTILEENIKLIDKNEELKKGIDYWKKECNKTYMYIDGDWVASNSENDNVVKIGLRNE